MITLILLLLYLFLGENEFKIRMGFGLHAGWAIEGAVGSLQKVNNSEYFKLLNFFTYIYLYLFIYIY
jgi:hypothetical protein